MNICMIQGDMLAERTAEQYPRVTLCDECIRRDRLAGEEALIVAVEGPAEVQAEQVCEGCGAEQ